jgi:NAD(P)-dependent dehydrogenase (short-subunit alcohol dehydrogenase family)
MIEQANVSPDESQSMNDPMNNPNPKAAALEGKVTLITGASRGIGLAIAESLSRMGAQVALCARDEKRLQAVVGEFERDGRKAIAVAADVSRASDISAAVRKTEQELGPIEILVNNAGIGYFAPVQEASEDKWDAVLDTNLKSVCSSSAKPSRQG